MNEASAPRMTPCARTRSLVLAGLVLCFGGQSLLVYADEPGPVQLEDQALRGAEVWHEESCQSCHALYGYGGFLGPDLTNFASRGDKTRLDVWLMAGPGAMPQFDLPDEDREALWSWLEALDTSGQGQARATDWWEYR